MQYISVKDLTLGPLRHAIGHEAVDLEIRLESSGLKHDEWLIMGYSDVSSLTFDVAAPRRTLRCPVDAAASQTGSATTENTPGSAGVPRHHPPRPSRTESVLC